MRSIRLGIVVAGVVALLGSGGGGGDGSSGGTTICLNCAGLSGTSRLQCQIQNSNIPGCDEPATAGPPNSINSLSFASPAVPAYPVSGGLAAAVPAGTDLTALVASFTVGGPVGATVVVNGVQQSSGVTPNNFTSPVTYVVIPATGATNRQTVTVAPAPATNIWTWVSGAAAQAAPAVYGTRGVAATGNTPGARIAAVSWVDSSGKAWLFGGSGTAGRLNDLWTFDGTRWAWVGGANTPQQPGSYGTQGVAAPANQPGARQGATAWKDAAGNFWLFGGYGHDASGTIGYLNDLWRFDGTNWAWMGGANTANAAGVYGTKGVAAPGNGPEGRSSAASWRDNAGQFWIFGGTGPRSELNDLWRFDGTNWAWMAGSDLASQRGVYGTKGTAAPGNAPGARQKAVAWVDAAGHLMLFGGTGNAAVRHGLLDDVWRFDGANWTWVAGTNDVDARPAGGVVGSAAPTNTPGGRAGAAGWTDAAGRFWLHGGAGISINGGPESPREPWRFDGSAWTAVWPASFVSHGYPYGAKGLPIVFETYPRGEAVAWADPTGVAWVFSGSGYDDLMRYQP